MGIIFRNGIPYGGGGGGNEPIEAEENQILVGDGDDWAKGGPFKTTAEEGVINLEAQFDSAYEEGNLKNGIINIQGNFAKAGQKMPVTTWSDWTQNVPCLTLSQDAIALFQNSYTKVVDSEICIAESSKIHIDGVTPSIRSLFDNRDVLGPEITIHNNISLAINPSSNPSYEKKAPQIDLLGNLFIKISSDPGSTGGNRVPAFTHAPGARTHNILNNQSSMKYKRGVPTFVDSSAPVATYDMPSYQGCYIELMDSPYFRMTDCTTLDFNGAGNLTVKDFASARFADRSTIEIAGDADIKVLEAAQMTLDKTSRFFMTDTSLFKAMGGQIVFATYAPDGAGLAARAPAGHDGVTSKIVDGSYAGSYLSSRINGSFSSYTPDNFDKEGVFVLEKKCNVHLGTQYGGYTTIVAGALAGKHLYALEPENGDSIIKFAPANNFCSLIDNTGRFYSKISNKKDCSIVLTPNKFFNKTCQPAGIYKELINSEYYMARYEGRHHEDYWGNSRIIMRGEGDPSGSSFQIGSENWVAQVSFLTEHRYIEGEGETELNTYTTDGTSDYTLFENKFNEAVPDPYGNDPWNFSYYGYQIQGAKSVPAVDNFLFLDITVTLGGRYDVSIPSDIYNAHRSNFLSAMRDEMTKINNGQLSELNDIGEFLLSYFGPDIVYNPSKTGIRNDSYYNPWVWMHSITGTATIRVALPNIQDDDPDYLSIVPDMLVNDLPTSIKNLVKATYSLQPPGEYYSYTCESKNWCLSNSYDSDVVHVVRYSGTTTYGKVIRKYARSDASWRTTVTFTTKCADEAQQTWDKPVQTKANAPTFQLYNSSNLVMRGDFTNEFIMSSGYDTELPQNFDTMTRKEKIAWFKNSTDPYTAFQAYLQSKGHTLININSVEVKTSYSTFKLNFSGQSQENSMGGYYYDVVSKTYKTCESGVFYGDGDTYTQTGGGADALIVNYTYQKTDHDSVVVGTGPVFEQTGASELRMHGGSTLKVEVEDGDTKVTFGNGDDQSITFTFQELQALKALLSNSITSTTVNAIESVQTAPQNPEQGTVYIVGGGQ